MRTLTLTQPWASLVAIGAKRIETRSWRTDYRGPVAIHAGKGLADMSNDEYIRLCFSEPFRSALGPHYETVKDIPRGVIVALARLVDCDHTYYFTDGIMNKEWMEQYEREREFGNYDKGRFAWLLADVQRLAQPIPARGALGLWDWQPPEDLKKALGLK